MRLQARWLGAWVLCTGIVLLASLGQAQESSDSPEGQTQQEQAPTEALPLPFPVEIVEDQAEAEARESRESEARQREIDDLAAQEGMNAATQAMNEATQRMADDSREMVNATWVGVFLLSVTLLLMWQANRAAVEAVNVSRQIGEIQTRAWLADDGVQVIRHLVSDAGKPRQVEHIIFRIPWRNVGATPALKVKIANRGTQGEFDPFVAASEIVDKSDSSCALAPNTGQVMAGQLVMTPEQIVSLRTRPYRVKAVAVYSTIHDDPTVEFARRSETAYKITYIGRANADEIRRGEIVIGPDNFQIENVADIGVMT